MTQRNGITKVQIDDKLPIPFRHDEIATTLALQRRQTIFNQYATSEMTLNCLATRRRNATAFIVRVRRQRTTTLHMMQRQSNVEVQK